MHGRDGVLLVENSVNPIKGVIIIIFKQECHSYKFENKPIVIKN